MEFRETLALAAPTRGLATYPSWQPQRGIDHILVSRGLESAQARVLDVTYSDHCPVALELELPDEIRLQQATRPVVQIDTG